MTSNIDAPIIINLELSQDQFTIGRHDKKGNYKSSFEFPDTIRSVSRQQACFMKNDDGLITLVDLGSKNGTMLNGKRLLSNAPININSGDIISFSDKGYDYILISE